MKKNVALFVIALLAALSIGLGVIFGKVSDANSKSTMESGYYDAEGYHSVSREEGYLGGSSEKKKIASTISKICYAFGGLNAVFFVIVLCKKSNKGYL